MQLGDPSVQEASSGEAVAAEESAAAAALLPEGGGDESDNNKTSNFGGNRWPRQETLALLKIRSDMDAVFRDSSLKGPLWEEVSRKLGDLGYERSAKKCKEKFENVYKYHKRTKESRSGKSDGKNYKFFDQLQALENQFTLSSSSSSYPPKPQPPPTTTTTTTALATNTVTLLPTRPTTPPPPIPCATTTVPSTNPTVQVIPPSPSTTITSTTVVTNPRNTSSQPNTATNITNNNNNDNNVSYSLPNMNLFSSTSTSSSTASDEDLEEKYRKKRKWKEYFRRLTRQVLTKQEEMQKRFLEAVEKREREQVAQQDAWRMQEMARINREHEILVQERSTAAAKDAAVIAFLQKLSAGQQSPPITTQQVATTLTFGANFLLQPQPQPQSQSQPQPQPKQQLPLVPLEIIKVNDEGNNGGAMMSPSRWPKSEVHALIRLRTSLETKYQENGPKAPLWEDISAGMQRLGYNRNAKRCKEKWENINKYFKKVKESKKQRREDSKTCPYFQELDAIYKHKTKNHNSTFFAAKPNDMMEPLMVQPEQQWRPPPQMEEEDHHQYHHVVVNSSSNNNNNNDACQEREEAQHEEEEEEVDDNGDDEDSVEDEGGNSRYEIATKKLSSVDTLP